MIDSVLVQKVIWLSFLISFSIFYLSIHLWTRDLNHHKITVKDNIWQVKKCLLKSLLKIINKCRNESTSDLPYSMKELSFSNITSTFWWSYVCLISVSSLLHFTKSKIQWYSFHSLFIQSSVFRTSDFMRFDSQTARIQQILVSIR
jgi:hypothetical protein